MGNIKFNVFKRATRIRDTAQKMNDLEEVLVDALENREDLNERQRAAVLKRVIDKVKANSRERVESLGNELNEAEAADDTLKSIMI